MKIKIPQSKPRDPNWAGLRHCKNGAHGKSHKALRRTQGVELSQIIKESDDLETAEDLLEELYGHS